MIALASYTLRAWTEENHEDLLLSNFQKSTEQRNMAESSFAALEETKNAVMGDLDLAFKVATTPRVSLGAHTPTRRIPLLQNIRHLLRIDLSAIDLFPPEVSPAAQEVPLLFLQGVLTYHRELASRLDCLLQIHDPLRQKRIRKLVGSRQEIESVLEALEDKIEDLEIATSLEVHTAIERLIDEAKAP
jgi:hypothetical protein